MSLTLSQLVMDRNFVKSGSGTKAKLFTYLGNLPETFIG